MVSFMFCVFYRNLKKTVPAPNLLSLVSFSLTFRLWHLLSQVLNSKLLCGFKSSVSWIQYICLEKTALEKYWLSLKINQPFKICLDILSAVQFGKPGIYVWLKKDVLSFQAAQTPAGTPDCWLNQPVAFPQRAFFGGPSGAFPDVQGCQRRLWWSSEEPRQVGRPKAHGGVSHASGKCPMVGQLWLGGWAVLGICKEGCLWDHPLGMDRIDLLSNDLLQFCLNLRGFISTGNNAFHVFLSFVENIPLFYLLGNYL